MTDYPVANLREAAPFLRRPFTPAAVKWKVQACWPKGNPHTGLIVAYIDARLVIDRLNLIVPDLWWAHYEPLGQGAMWCHLTVDQITRRDVGQGVGKGLISDSLKRAAVHFGIGVSLYAIPKMTLGGDALREQQTKNGPTLVLKAEGEAICRNAYAAWLDSQGGDAYGEALDHGDAADGGQGDPHEPEEADPDDTQAPDPWAPLAAAELARELPPRREAPPARGRGPMVTPGQVTLIEVRARAAGLDDAALAALLHDDYAAASPMELTRHDAGRLITHLDSLPTTTPENQ